MEQETLNNESTTESVVGELHKDIEFEIRQEITQPVEIKVVYWTGYEDAEENVYSSVGSWGGYFNLKDKGLRWVDYMANLDRDLRPYAQAVYDDIQISKRKISGHDHQYSEDGVPVFSDGKAGLWSQRGFSDLMSAIWSDIDDKDYSYLDFYLK